MSIDAIMMVSLFVSLVIFSYRYWHRVRLYPDYVMTVAFQEIMLAIVWFVCVATILR